MMPVYLIRAGETEFVKIGWATNPEQRCRELQISHWLELRIIRLIDGIPATERWLQRHFCAQHVRREWFHLVDEMLTVVPPEIEPNDRPTYPSALADYLSRERISAAEFARKAGIASRQVIHAYLQRTAFPSPENMVAIQQATSGKVTFNDFVRERGIG